MKPFKTMAHIHSLNGEMGEITVLDMKEDGRQTTYIVDYRRRRTQSLRNL